MKGELIYGLHAVQAALERHPELVLEVWLDTRRDDERLERLRQDIRALGIAQHPSTRRELDDLAGGATHQGVIARCRSLPVYDEQDLTQLLAALDEPAFLLVLDGVQDPHNLGACLRSADAAGVHAVIVPRDRAVSLTATVRKVACGAAETVPFIQVTNLGRTLKLLQQQGIWLTGAAGEAENSLYDADLTGPLGIVMGGEGKGLRRLTREHCDSLVRIPMAGTVESLNVSVATGICL
ncbi:MAG: 23S rRNA (guanosine(2251)-2'-O)-methyltransferase RlmB, partial [Gammaproteobacteria bacterium RBG_16_57_12]